PNTSIRSNAAATSVTPDGGGYKITFEDGSTLGADAVAVAAPAYAAGQLTKEMDPQLSSRLLAIPYVSTATVSIAFKKKDIKHPLNGFGFVVPKVEGRRIMAATWTSVKFNYRAPDDSILMRCFVGGSKNAELVSLNDADMIAMVRQELKDIMGVDAEPVLARVFRWMNSMPQYTIGHEDRIAAIEEDAARHPGFFLAGSAYHGIGISDSVRWSEVVAKKALHNMFGG
ncbi:MAG: protoporphyrinogen oxidase, partial [Deltaproteobacteria bacterium RIFCSPLOWO2_02_FULL_53_8]